MKTRINIYKIAVGTLFCLLFPAFCLNAFSQSDSAAYQIQRKKINGLLDSRNEKFGQYDQSLTKHTGIFGLKTKKDMQRSINILSDIVKTDNNILHELKVLLDYKDLEKSQVQTRVTDVSGRINAYMQTITKLQKQNDKLNNDLAAIEKKEATFTWIAVMLGIIVLFLLFILYKRRQAI